MRLHHIDAVPCCEIADALRLKDSVYLSHHSFRMRYMLVDMCTDDDVKSVVSKGNVRGATRMEMNGAFLEVFLCKLDGRLVRVDSINILHMF